MQLPVININGTSPSDLLEQHMLVKRHLAHAIEALQQACPHGRDYQTISHLDGGMAFQRAMDEHSNRLLRLRQVMVEIDTIAEHVV